MIIVITTNVILMTAGSQIDKYRKESEILRVVLPGLKKILRKKNIIFEFSEIICYNIIVVKTHELRLVCGLQSVENGSGMFSEG